MGNLIRIELYKFVRYKIIWCISVVFIAIGYMWSKYETKEFYMYDGLEYLLCSTNIAIFLECMVVVLIAFASGYDFSMRTIQNALTVGISKKKYYFSKLISLFFVILTLFSISFMVNVLCRIIYSKEYSNYQMDLFGIKAIVYFFTMLLQYFAIAALVYMVTYILKNQLVSMLIGLMVLYGEVVIRVVFEAYNVKVIGLVLEYLPIGALININEYATRNKILNACFLRYAIFAVLMVILFSVIGYLKFVYDDCKGEK